MAPCTQTMKDNLRDREECERILICVVVFFLICSIDYFAMIVFLACPFVGGLGIVVALNSWIQLQRMKLRSLIGSVGGLMVGWALGKYGIPPEPMESFYCFYCSMFGLGLIFGSFLDKQRLMIMIN